MSYKPVVLEKYNKAVFFPIWRTLLHLLYDIKIIYPLLYSYHNSSTN